MACAALLAALPACRSKSHPEPREIGGFVMHPKMVWRGFLREAKVNADAVPDLVGECSVDGITGPTCLCAADGASFEILWHSEPLEEIETASEARLGIAGGRVVLVDALAHIHIYDLATGKTLPAGLRLEDRPLSICAPKEAPGELWLKRGNGSGWRVDPISRTVETAAREPPSCLIERCSEPQAQMLQDDDCMTAMPRPDIPGFGIYSAIVDGSDGAATIFALEAATRTRIAGFTPASAGRPATLRWQRDIVADEPLRVASVATQGPWIVAGRLIVAYTDVLRADHVEAIDAKTGATLWDVVPRAGSSDLRVTATRIYWQRDGTAYALDAATGKELGCVGRNAPTSR